MIVLIGGEKGGTGKSSLCVNLAVWLAHKGKDVLILDTDPQETSAQWAFSRKKIGLPAIPCVQKHGDVSETIIDLGKRCECLLVDAGGRDTPELRSSLIAADLVISPFQPSQFDIQTTVKMDDLIHKAKFMNRKLRSRGMASRLSTNPKAHEREEVASFLEDFKTLHLLKGATYERKVYKDSARKSLGVLEMGNKKACDEINAIAQEIFAL